MSKCTSFTKLSVCFCAIYRLAIHGERVYYGDGGGRWVEIYVRVTRTVCANERQALGRERAASLSANCNLTPVQKCQPDYMRSRRRLRHREGSGEARAGARTKPVSAEAKLRGRSERRLRRSKGSAKWRLREAKAPARNEAGAEEKRCRNGAVPERSRCRPKGLASRRSERSISKGRKAATAFSPQPGRRRARNERGNRRRAYGSAQRRLRRRYEAGAGTKRCRERGRRTDAKADGPTGRLPSPLRSGGPEAGIDGIESIGELTGLLSDLDHSARMINLPNLSSISIFSKKRSLPGVGRLPV